MKLWIGLSFIGILGSLLAAGVFMARGGPNDKEKSQRMANALTWRIGLSVVLFLCLLGCYALGWIQPKGILFGA